MQHSNSSHRRQRDPSMKPTLSTDFDIAGLERFLVTAFDYGSRHSSVVSAAQREARDLSRRLREYGARHCADELLQLADLLSELVNTRQLSPLVVFQVHYFTGQIYQTHFNYDAAIQSYLRAAWIGAAAQDIIPRVLFALTLHRLSICYGETGSYKKAATLLARVLDLYRNCQVKEKSEVYVQARRLGREYASLCKASDESFSSFGASFKSLLPMIDEGAEDEDAPCKP
ncbi:hypothetical protein MPSEU_000609300 [Mayamaea pseudoterrestris]|nr:hypothetical protein MPSEU_000609300 [Mayamaea pseudoterrestris]